MAGKASVDRRVLLGAAVGAELPELVDGDAHLVGDGDHAALVAADEADVAEHEVTGPAQLDEVLRAAPSRRRRPGSSRPG